MKKVVWGILGAVSVLLLCLQEEDRISESRDLMSRLDKKADEVKVVLGKVSEPGSKTLEPEEYWLQYANDSSSYGVEFEESGPRIFLNSSQNVLKKAIKSLEDRSSLLDLLNQPLNHQAILQHYGSLPKDFHFVEEASRVKMLNLLIAGLEITQGDHTETLQTVDSILKIQPSTVANEGLAKSIAGDQLRLLAALHKYAPVHYQSVASELKREESQSKIIAYFETSLVQD